MTSLELEGIEREEFRDQIFYRVWGSENKEHKGYFETIETIAKWIAALLEHSLPEKRIDGALSAPFHCVHKEKWGTARVYCGLLSLEQKIKYRSIYLEAKEVWPQYWYAISSGADYSEYLCESKEEFIKHFYVNAYRYQDINDIYEVCGWK